MEYLFRLKIDIDKGQILRKVTAIYQKIKPPVQILDGLVFVRKDEGYLQS
ncbi:hypothetical protein CLV93_1136 [Prolixibacter denitrificans]|uniref:Uncharacterized protein n=1 Tax=Prolixibacter denitrificans TaxID=1541063 RepID=A0A2P8C6X1_9BACT|nr:hypothetical protein [Prolixibacter denitrificans]PSK80712.1 hypothetical protein CLV93_1136 [Prolixibacter denitrificans]